MKRNNILMTHMSLTLGGAETHLVVLSKRLKDLGYNIIVATSGGPYEKELTDYGIKHYKVPLDTKEPFKVIQSFFALSKIIKNEKIDLIHAHARIPAFISNLLSKIYKINFITTGHYNFRSNAILKPLSKWGEKTIVVSQDIKEYFNKTFDVPNENMTVITNGIDTQKFKKGIDYSSFNDKYHIDDSYKKIVLISRVDDKLADIMLNLIDTADKLSNDFEKIAIFIVGKGNRLEEVQKYAEEKNEKLGKKIVFVPGGTSKVPELINFSDVFIGISRAALEAMSCEKPVILAGVWSYMGILNENIVEQCKSDNFTGRSFNQPATTEILYDSIVKVLNMSDEEKTHIGELGRKIVLEDYSDMTMAESTAKVYEQVLNNGGDKQ